MRIGALTNTGSVVSAFVLCGASALLAAAPQQDGAEGELRLQEPRSASLTPGEEHRWSLTIDEGSYVVVEARQQGVDVVLRIIDPSGEARREIDGPTGNAGTETATWIADPGGTWIAHVTVWEGSPAGEYEIEWTTASTATESDLAAMEVDSLNATAAAAYEIGDVDETIAILQRALALRESSLGPNHPDVATSLNNLARVYFEQSRFDEAEPLFQRAVAIADTELGPNHPDVAAYISGLANVYTEQARFAEAEPLFQRSVAVSESAYGPDHPDVASGLDNLAGLYAEMGRYDDAEPLYDRALAINEATLDPNDPTIGILLNNMAVLYETQGRLAEALVAYNRALAIFETLVGPDHPAVGTVLDNMVDLYQAFGEYETALAAATRSLRIREAAFGPDHPDVAMSLNTLGYIYYYLGRFSEAEQLYLRALVIFEEVLGPEHPRVAMTLNNLGILYEDQGRAAEAEPLMVRALAIHEAVLGPEHRDVAAALNNLAFSYMEQGRYAAADSLLRRARRIRETALGPEHGLVAQSLNNLATVNQELGRYEEAEELLMTSLAIWETALGPDNPEVAKVLDNLANLYRELDRNAEALPLSDRAVAIFDATTGEAYARIRSYGLRARIRWELGDTDGAIDDLAEALGQAEELRPQTGGGEQARAAAFERYGGDFEQMIFWQLEVVDVEAAFEYAERGRSRVLLDQLAAGKVDIRSSIPTDVREPLEERESAARSRLAELQQRMTLLRGRTDLSDDERLVRLDGLGDSLRVVEREYAQIYAQVKNASPLWRDLITSGGQPVALSTVQRRLVPEDGLLMLYQVGAEESYLFVVPGLRGEVEAVPLEVGSVAAAQLGVEPGPLTAAGLDTATASLVTVLSDRSRGLGGAGDGKQSSAARLNALWQVLVPESVRARVLAASEVVVVPDGALHRVPFEALVVTPGRDASGTRFWLDEGPVVRYAASATSLYNISQRPAARVGAGAAGLLSLSNPVYDPTEVAELQAGAEARVVAANAGNRSSERAGGSLSRLPGTALETEAIEAAFGVDRASGEIVVLQELNATEPALRGAVEGKRYLHLATHGTVDERRGALFASLALTPPAGETSDSEDDGLLQLYEIYALRLPEAELAVLSACETNVGASVEGEGVFALSRGFLAAGARRVIASQWSVDDASTAALMREFFGRIAAAEQRGEPVDYAAALRDAKQVVRAQPQWADPFYWAPFILTGKE